MDLSSVFESVLSGHGVLITGSGINAEVKNCKGESFLTGSQLAAELYSYCGIARPDDPGDLQDASETFMEQHGAAELIAKLKTTFSIAEVGDTVSQLYSMPWIRSYTTNYDEGPVIGGKNKAVTLKTPTREYIDKSSVCVYINGYLGNLSEATINTEFKLTSKSYLSAENILNCNWGEVLRNDLELAEVVVIAGLSLNYDLDIKRIVATQDLSKKIYFIERPDLSDDSCRKMSRIGKVCPIGIDGFIQQLVEYKTNSYKEHTEPHKLKCFEEYKLVSPKKKPSSLDIHALFMTGSITPNLFWKEKWKYCGAVYRESIKEMIDNVLSGKRVIFLHANLGNGKTFLLEMFKQKISAKAIEVYTFLENANKRELLDIDLIVSRETKKVVIIENYFNHMDIIKGFSLHNTSNITFVLSARTMIYETKLIDVCKLLSVGENDVIALDVNRLSRNEINNCYDILEKNQLWGDYSDSSSSQKKRILMNKNNGNSEMQTIMLDIIHSSSLRNEIQKEVELIKRQSYDFYRGFVILLVARIMALELSVQDVNRMLNIQCMNNPVYSNNEAVKEFVEFQNEGKMEFRIKSAVVAKEIVASLCKDGEIIESLTMIARFSDQYYEAPKYESLLQNIVSFSHVNSFLNGKRDRISFIIEYYDSLKELDYYKNNSFFWLQYSIACLKYKNYSLAQRYVDVSYAKFRSSKFSVPFQCDNHQARILLQKIQDGKSDNVTQDYKKAHELIMKPSGSELDREENTIRLLFYYINNRFYQVVESGGLLDIYRSYCSDAYSRTQQFIKTMRNLRDKDRYSHLADELLKSSVVKR